MNKSASGWVLVGVQALLLLALVLAPSRRGVSQLWPPDAAAVIGVLLIAAGVVIGVLAARELSSALTPTPVPREGERLRTSGVYAWVRHPIYTAVLLAALGYTVALGGRWQLLTTALLAVFFVAKSRWEDSLLAAEHGADWEEYKRRTSALIPRPPH
jgi:protein-S-isoprenylcysteine O-methyltransferase Ste14